MSSLNTNADNYVTEFRYAHNLFIKQRQYVYVDQAERFIEGFADTVVSVAKNFNKLGEGQKSIQMESIQTYAVELHYSEHFVVNALFQTDILRSIQVYKQTYY